MDDFPEKREIECKLILAQIITDFEQLDLAIEAVIKDMQAAPALAYDIKTLQRARDAARKGASLAKHKLDSQ